MGRQEAFEEFRRDHESSISIEDNKKLLKQRCSEAKRLGEHVNQARTNINKLKAGIEQYRVSQVMEGLMDPENQVVDQHEERIRKQIQDEKDSYKESFKRLRALKTEIEHLQHLLERSKLKLMKDFEIWWAEQTTSTPNVIPANQLPAVKSAWKMAPTNGLGNKTLSHSQSSLASASTVTNSVANRSRTSSQLGTLRSNKSRAVDSSMTSGPTGETIQLTGDDEADANILAFLKARQTILSHTQGRPR